MAIANKSACGSPSADPGNNHGEPSPQDGQVYSCNPVNVGTGVKSQVDVDYRAPSGLEFKRVYNSQSAYEASLPMSLGNGGMRLGWNRSIRVDTAPPPPFYPPLYGTTVYRLGLAPSWTDVTNTTATTAYVSRGDGKTYTYTRSGDAWQTSADVKDQLASQFDAAGNLTGWTYTTESHEVEQYNAFGQLVSITDRAGQAANQAYSDGTAANGGYVLDAAGVATTTVLPSGLLIRITDAHQRSLNLGYDALGRIVKMTDPAGGAYIYAYDAHSNLISVTYPDGKTKQYLYENATHIHALTGIIDENGSRYATYAYDSAGRAISTEHAGGAERVSLTYNGNGTTDITDALGTVRTQAFQTVLGVVKGSGASQPGGSGCGSSSSGVAYDANGNAASRTDFNGNTACYAYDLARNLETVRLEGLPAGVACPADMAAYAPSTAAGSVERKTTTQWHATLRLPETVAEPLRITDYTYDAQSNLLDKSVQPTDDATGAQGLSAVVTGTARTTGYTYNAAGQVLTVDGPRTDVADIAAYAYDAQGNLITVTNALDQTTTLSGYDANGRPGALTDPNGLVTSLTYDARGRLTSRSSGGETTSYTYDGVGQLLAVSTPGGAAYTYTYDAAHRMTGIAENMGNRINYTLDLMGNRTREQILDSANNIVQTHSRAFDALNRLWKDIGAINQTTVYEYDASGNLTKVTDPLNRQTVNTYDALNRLITGTDPASGQTRYGYNGQDQLTSVTDPRSLVTQYTRDGLGNLKQQTSPDTGASANTFDAAGNLRARTDAKGQAATYTYDALNRLTGIGYSGGTAPAQTVTYQYDQGMDGIGHLTGITDITGATAYTYDQRGRLTGEARQLSVGATYTTAYAYDTQGRLNVITYPSGRTVGYSFDTLGRINRIATSYGGNTQVLASNIVYEPFGGVRSFTYGDGVTEPVQAYTRQRDQDGRIASYTLNDQALHISYDAASQISSITDPTLPSTANYSYDALSRLGGYTEGTINQSYTYDPGGNRISQTVGGILTSYSYAPGSNRLTGAQTGNWIKFLTQDANGSTTSDDIRQYGYDVRGRLIQAATAQGVINYEVNALGLRVRKRAPYANTDTTYHYDTQGHLIGENPTGISQFTREYIYLGDQPVAVMQ